MWRFSTLSFISVYFAKNILLFYYNTYLENKPAKIFISRLMACITIKISVMRKAVKNVNV